MKPEDDRILVAIGEPMDGVRGVPTVILGMPRGSWDAMAGGQTHSFDLTKIGIPVQILMFREADGAAVAAKLAEVGIMLSQDAEDADGNLRNLGIEEPTQQ